jgi:hypothetical protein
VKWVEVPHTEKKRLADMYAKGMPLNDEACRLGMNLESLKRYIRDYRYYRRLFLGSMANLVAVPPALTEKFDDYETIVADDFLVISDIEIPDHSVQYLRYALLTAMVHGIKTLIIAGDLVATDQEVLTGFAQLYKRGDESSFRTAIRVTRHLLAEYGKWFDDIYILEGNHDDRIARATKGEIDLGMFLEYTGAKYSRYSYMWVDTSRGPVRVIHPRNFSQYPITLAAKLYNKHPRKAHMVMAHCHRREDGWTEDGAYEIHCLGTGRDKDRTKYKMLRVANFCEWDASFLMVKRGFFYPLDLNASDWQELWGDMYPLYQKQFKEVL